MEGRTDPTHELKLASLSALVLRGYELTEKDISNIEVILGYKIASKEVVYTILANWRKSADLSAIRSRCEKM